ncbi:MAG TPA: lipoprotein [Pseudolabrys sp.]|nr:lipoprotein [Pseudolabrys sp.]
MSRNVSPFLRLALVAAMATSFALVGCGRKGPLDPPPAASLAGEQVAPADAKENTYAGRPTGPDGKPLLPAGPNKRIPLDVLLN